MKISTEYILQFKEGRKWKTGGGFSYKKENRAIAMKKSMSTAFPNMKYRLVLIITTKEILP